MLIAIKTSWELHGLRVVFGTVCLRGLVQQSYDRRLWFITFSIADSTQNAILCQQEPKEFRRCRNSKEMEDTPFRVERQKESKDGNNFKSSIPRGTESMRVKWCGIFPLTPLCSSKLSQTNTNRHSSFIFLLLIFKISYSYVSLEWLSNREIKKECFQVFIRIVLLPPTCVHLS